MLIDDDTDSEIETPEEDSEFEYDNGSDNIASEFIDSTQSAEDYLLAALQLFSETDDDEAMTWNHPDARTCMLASGGNAISLFCDIDGERREFRIVIHEIDQY